MAHIARITPGRYRLGEVGVDRVGGEGLVFAVLEHPRGGWILNAVGPKETLPTLEEAQAALKALGLEEGRWRWIEDLDDYLDEVEVAPEEAWRAEPLDEVMG
ncbi:MAG: DUF6303 family protein [Brevundimonas sp.]